MAPSLPKQLDAADAVFLSLETQTCGGHVGALMVLDPTDREDFDFERLSSHVASRISLVPRFSWKIETVAMDLDRPYWVEAEDFDPRDQIIRTAVPSPGNMEQVWALASRLHVQPIDRTRPLWEIWYIEGLEGGRVALYMKTHHCLVDGTGGAGLGEVMADLVPDAVAPPIVPAGFDEEPPAPPTTLDVLAAATRNGAARPGHLMRHLGLALREFVLPKKDAVEVERRSFNRIVGRRRAFAATSFDLERVRNLTKHFDVKVNDVVLELAGSAVRRWLRDRGETSDTPLVAMCPVSTRGDEEGLGNQITSMVVPLATNLADPAERLLAIHEASKRAKQGVEDGNFDYIAALGESLPPAVAKLVMSAADLAGDNAPLPGNFVVSNVRSTPVPLYLAGARLESMIPLSMLATGQGMNITLVSYCNRIDVGIIVDPELVPDPAELAAYFPAALEELESAAEGVVHRAA